MVGWEVFHAPDIVGLEVLQTFRGLIRGGKVSPGRAEAAVTDFSRFRLVRHHHARYEGRVWELRDALTAYDAAYVAVAEALDASLITADARMMRAAVDLVPIVDYQ